jgi:hypothetical protein
MFLTLCVIYDMADIEFFVQKMLILISYSVVYFITNYMIGAICVLSWSIQWSGKRRQ